MRKIFFLFPLLFCLLSSTYAQNMSNDKALQVSQKATFNVQYSEKLAVYHFVKNLTGKYGENPFKKEFEKSKYHEKKYLDLLAQFDNLKIDYLYSFSGFPYGVKIPMLTENALQKHLIAATSLQDFKCGLWV
jgi:hypothetical protein